MQERTDDTWRDDATAERFIKEVVGGIPLESEQLDIMMRLIAVERDSVGSFMDLGCGNGMLASVILRQYPNAVGILLDFNDTMLKAAKEKMSDYGEHIKYVKSDYGNESLRLSVPQDTKGLDVIVSRFSIHHQTDERKRSLYREIFELLNPGGIFINIEHVAPVGRVMGKVFAEYLIDHIYDHQKNIGKDKSREDVAEEFRARHEKDTNIVASAEQQCAWLKDIGFMDVGCYFKVLDIAVFGGMKET